MVSPVCSPYLAGQLPLCETTGEKERERKEVEEEEKERERERLYTVLSTTHLPTFMCTVGVHCEYKLYMCTNKDSIADRATCTGQLHTLYCTQNW